MPPRNSLRFGLRPRLRSVMSRLLRQLVACGLPLLAACGCHEAHQGPLTVAVVGDPATFLADTYPLPPGGNVLRGATLEGLVGFDAEGRVVPALAERWLITADGLSYIFRLRDGQWADGAPIDSASMVTALQRQRARLAHTPLALDLAAVTAIRAMSPRVVELDLAAPQPELLTLLAQPELGLAHGSHADPAHGTGPLRLAGRSPAFTLTLPAPDDDTDRETRPTRAIALVAAPVEAAVARFDAGQADVVLGGTTLSSPLSLVRGVSRGDVRFDPVTGQFGLTVARPSGFLASAANREALAMAIDRAALVAAFNVAGWQPTTRLAAGGLPDDAGTIGERWTDLSPAERQQRASQRVAAWVAGSGGGIRPVIALAVPRSSGGALLASRLATDFAAIGVTLVAVGPDEPADLRVLDRVARYPSVAWFLDAVSCVALPGACNPAGDVHLAEARATRDPASRAALLAEAEAAITAANGFIPLARPLRWSLVRSTVTGFAPNPWGWHPLAPLAQPGG